MFTGIIQEFGTVRKICKSGNRYDLDIRSGDIYKTVKIGDSIAVDGVCLTVTRKDKDLLSFDVMAETVRSTNLSGLKNGTRVNLEGALKAGATLDGHFVLGHVDCVGVVRQIKKAGDDFMIRIGFSGDFGRLIVEKGSIAVDGISLTVNRADNNSFDVHIIPHTLKSTTLSIKGVGESVNLEFDILGKYIAKHAPPGSRSHISEEFLRSKGF